MAYTAFTKYYQIAQFALNYHGDKVTQAQLEHSISMIIGTNDPRTIAKYFEAIQKDYSPICRAQFVKQDKDSYMVRPNRPKTPNQLIGDAYNAKNP
jgi:hypothetical protein